MSPLFYIFYIQETKIKLTAIRIFYQLQNMSKILSKVQFVINYLNFYVL